MTDTLIPTKSISAEVILYSCGIGATLGALMVALPPFVDWSPLGALYSMVLVLVLSHAGCFVSMMTNSLIEAITT